MKCQFLVFALALGLAASASVPEISSYAKVTKNGEESGHSSRGLVSSLVNTFMKSNATDKKEVNEGRSADISFTVSPVYVPPKIPTLHKGEAVDYPTTKRYSTLDEEMVSRLDAKSARRQAQDRFHPPAAFEHEVAHANAAKQLASVSSSSGSGPPASFSGPPSRPSSDSTYDYFPPGPSSSQPVFPGTYDYKPPDFIDAKPAAPQSSPMMISSYSPPKMPSSGPSISHDSPPDSYGPPPDYLDHPPDGHDSEPEFDHDFHASSYGSGPIYGGSIPPKSIQYAGHFDHPAHVDDPYIHDHPHDHDYPHDIIYDHIPDDHFYHEAPSTLPPEMSDERLNKKPYSYYFIGKKLWYLPLYFSIYFIIYIAALVLKSISRHKINFPENLANAISHDRRSMSSQDGPGWIDMTVKVLEGIETARKAFQNKS